MNIVDIAEEALDAYETIDLSVVVASFSSCMDALWKIAKDEGWARMDTINRHPISVLFADRIANLVSPGSSLEGADYYRAYSWARDIINWGRI